MTDKQFRFARTSQCYCLGQRENACSKANCTHMIKVGARFGAYDSEAVAGPRGWTLDGTTEPSLSGARAPGLATGE